VELGNHGSCICGEEDGMEKTEGHRETYKTRGAKI